ncbi:hypothetical protein KPH14_012036, partial [Odynerus spinipes]
MKLETNSKGRRIVKLQRPIYGLKQSGHNWNDALDGFLTKIGLIRLSTSNCIYRLDYHTFVIIYVDDILIFSQEEKTLNEVAEKIGIGVHHTEDEIILNQEAYIRSLIKEYGLQDRRPSHTPLERGIKLSKEDCPITDGERDAIKNVPYRQLIGSLMKVHWTEAKRVLRYLSDTSKFGLTYKRTEPILELWTDADWAGDVDDRHSFSGTVVGIGGNIVEWRATKQKCISTSTMEAEYVAILRQEQENLERSRREGSTPVEQIMRELRAEMDPFKNLINQLKEQVDDIQKHSRDPVHRRSNNLESQVQPMVDDEEPHDTRAEIKSVNTQSLRLKDAIES